MRLRRKIPLFASILIAPFLVSGVPQVSRTVSFPGLGEWSDDGRVFVPNLRASYRLSTRDHIVVMVSYAPLSKFEARILADKRMMAFFRNTSTGVARAVLRLSSPEERDALAAEVHDHTHLCGSLEVLDLNRQTVLLDEAAPPMVATTVRSASLVDMLTKISTENMEASVSALQNLGTRYHAGASPNTASDTVKSSWEQNAPARAVVVQVSHATSKNTNQKSVKLTIPALASSTETVVLGAHLDSINKADQTQAPGADDNASGIAALTEILRVIKSTGATFTRNIEFHAYAAEEVGLLGSADIASTASSASQKVTAMLQLDMIGYSSVTNDETLHLVTTDTSPVLVRHLKDLISIYGLGTWKTGALSAGTSDHKSWKNYGFHAAFAFENPADYNKAIHTSADTSEALSFPLAGRFARLALAFLAHEAGMTAAVSDTAQAWEAQKATDDAIKLAAFSSVTGGERMAIAVAGAAHSAEFCRVTNGTVTGCQTMNTDTRLAQEKSGRVFFVTTTDVTITEGDSWRVNAYTATGELLAMRTARLRKN